MRLPDIATDADGKRLSTRLPVIFCLFALAYFLSYVYRGANLPLAADLARDIGLNGEGLGLLSAAYFLGFAAAQVPVGVLLDRFGPRRTVGAFLCAAASGGILFAGADNFGQALLARGLIGAGVASCLMGAFKAINDAFPSRAISAANGGVLAIGTSGAIVTGAPVRRLNELIGWRPVYLLLGIASAINAILVLALMRDARRHGSEAPPRHESSLSDLGRLLADRNLRRIVLPSVVSQSVFLAVSGLWAGPFLTTVAHANAQEVARIVSAMGIGLVVGNLSVGWV